jgi:hypothetical protein
MIAIDKTRENRLRLTCERRGLRLEKNRRRDPKAIGFGRYRIVKADAPAAGARFDMSLDQVEAWLAEQPAVLVLVQADIVR